MEFQRLIHLIADREDRVQRRHGVLENNRAVVPAERIQLFLRVLQEAFALEFDVAFDDASVLVKDLQDAVRRHGLAGAGFADDAEDLARVQVEGDAVDRLDFTGVCDEARVQVLDREDRVVARGPMRFRVGDTHIDLSDFLFRHVDRLLTFSASGRMRHAVHRR